MSGWSEIHREYPPPALWAGWVYIRWIKLRRLLRYALGRSGRTWHWHDVSCTHAGVRILE